MSQGLGKELAGAGHVAVVDGVNGEPAAVTVGGVALGRRGGRKGLVSLRGGREGGEGGEGRREGATPNIPSWVACASSS